MTDAPDFYTPSLRQKYGIEDYTPPETLANHPPTAKIDWVPNEEEFMERTAASLKDKDLAKTVPDGWPTVLEGPLVWSGEDKKTDKSFVVDLSTEQITEIDKALAAVKAASIDDLERIGKANFVLPTLGPILEEMSKRVHQGGGFAILRGLKPDGYSREDNAIIYIGVSSYIGEKRARQNMNGLKIMLITDVNADEEIVAEPRPIHSNKAQPFHTDIVCDVLALYHIETAKSGGDSLIAPCWTVYNELAATRPDIIRTLAADDWVHDTFGHNPPFYNRPLVFYEDGKIIFNFSRRVLTGAPMTPRSTNIPPMTEAQAEALDAVHYSALKHCLNLQVKKGDMCFINNLAFMHSRTAFEDRDDSRRLIMRLWLNNPELAWKIPPGLQLAWDRMNAPLPEIKDYYDVNQTSDKAKVLAIAGGASTQCS